LAADGAVNVTVCNTDPENAAPVELVLSGKKLKLVDARMLASAVLTACNTFEQPRTVTTKPFADVAISNDTARFTLPPGSVATLRLG
jgi:alpha-N-arabinofuranosidase